MTGRVREKRAKPKKAVDIIPENEEKKRLNAEKVKAEMDAVLDDIDAVLEENAEEFVKSYVQKGGE